MKDTFGVQQQSEAVKTEPEKQSTLFSTVLSLAWKWDARLKDIIRIQSEMTTEEATSKSSPENKTNNTNNASQGSQQEPSWLRILLFFLSGILGMWGTLTIWNDGMEGLNGITFVLGPVEPLTGFLAIFACILSVFLFHEAVGGFDIED